jgi:quinoprotein glucose dehydrogenase
MESQKMIFGKSLSKRQVAFALIASLACSVALVYGATRAMGAQKGATANLDWPDYEGGIESPQYSPLNQINKNTVKALDVAWSYQAPSQGRGRFGFNPVVVDGMMFVLGADNALVALDATTGKEIWKHANSAGITSRGINYWTSKDRKDRRVIYASNSFLQELDARTGVEISTFGKDGKIDLRLGLGRDPKSIVSIQSGTPGRLFDNILILGSSTGEEYASPPGDIRAYDVLSGQMLWTFHTVPHPGEPGYETWPPDAWKYAGGTNDWGGMTIDEKRGLVFIPTGSSTYDFYGADRKGADLYADCLLALDVHTGKLKWYFQFVHHDLWDYDATTSPKLLTVTHNGKMVDIVAQATKQGFLYAFNRETGEPLWPVVEKPVPQTDVPGEQSWPTQPFPTQLQPFARQSFTVADVNPYITDPADLAKIKDFVGSARNEGLFTPPGFRNTMEIPGNNGGANWGAAATDPASGHLFIMSKDAPTMLKLVAELPRGGPGSSVEVLGRGYYQDNCQTCHGVDRQGHAGVSPSLVDVPKTLGADGIKTVVHSGRNGMPAFANLPDDQLNDIIAYLTNPDAGDNPPARGGRGTPAVPPPATPGTKYWSGYGTMDAANGMPDIGPPWSSLTAYDMNKGVITWKIPLGETKSLAEQGHTDTGSYWPRGGPVATAGGLVFIGTGGDLTVHAYDEDTGKEVWQHQLESAPDGIPSVYEVNGREYVAFCTRGFMASDNLPQNLNTAAQMVPKKEAQGYYVFALPEKAGAAKKK